MTYLPFYTNKLICEGRMGVNKKKKCLEKNQRPFLLVFFSPVFSYMDYLETHFSSQPIVWIFFVFIF